MREERERARKKEGGSGAAHGIKVGRGSCLIAVLPAFCESAVASLHPP